jgi:GTP cyclohydrolase II
MNYLDGFVGSRASINSRTWGPLSIESVSFSQAIDGDLVINVGQPLQQPLPLVRIHSTCIFSEVLDSDFCDCAEQFHLAMDAIVREGHGILFYLRFEARGAGLAAKVKATALEISGLDTYDSRISVGVSPESRDFSPIGAYLLGRGIKKIRLLTNNPLKVDHLERTGLSIEREPLLSKEPNDHVKALYRTKARRFHHWTPEL